MFKFFYSPKIIIDRNIAFFSAYSKDKKVDDSTLLYISELLIYFDKVIVASNNSFLLNEINSFFATKKIETLKVWNEGYDFGMYYKIIKRFEFKNIQTLCLANDSCIVINPIDTIIKSFINSEVEYYGITSSNEKHTHIQSYFLMMKLKAIDLFFKHIKKNGIKRKYRRVIRTYELGLTKLMLQNNITIGAFYKSPDNYLLNPTYFKIEELIKLQCPIVKKNLFTGIYRHNAAKLLEQNNLSIDKNNYIDFVKRYCKSIDILPPSILKSEMQ